MSTCAVCGALDNDLRLLKMRHGYDLREVSSKFETEQDAGGSWFYSMSTCKECRGNLLGILAYWAEGNLVQTETHPEKNIPVRVHGREVMMNKEEYEKYLKDKQARNS